MPSKVIILGTARSSLEDAPFADESYEVWGCGNAWQYTPRYDRWFEFHDISALAGHLETYGDHIKWLQEATIPIMVSKDCDILTNPELFPIKEITDMFGRYFTNTISLMIAYAVYKGKKEIALYGVNMAFSGEYQEQRPSCEYILGVATGMGIKVIIPNTSDLLKCGTLYGFEEPPRLEQLIRAKEQILKRELATVDAGELQAAESRLVIQGSLQMLRYVRNHLT